MRWGTLLTGMVVGAGTYYVVKDQVAAAKQNREIERQNAESSQAHDDLEHMLDDVVHRDDIPETPVKQAFESALGEHEHHTHH